MPDEPNSFNENKKTSVVEKFLQNTDKHIAPASLRVINSVFSKKNPISNRGAATLPRVVKNGANSLLIKEELGKNFTEIMRSQELNDNHRSILTLIYDIETKPINVVTGDVKKVDYLLNIINQDLDLLDNVSANKLVNDPKYSEQAKYINSVATLILPPNSKQALFGSRVAVFGIKIKNIKNILLKSKNKAVPTNVSLNSKQAKGEGRQNNTWYESYNKNKIKQNKKRGVSSIF